MPRVQRMTLFKIPDPANIEKTLQAYSKLESEQEKGGKPYIVSLKAYELHDDSRSAGFTLAAQTIFASLEDMRYYDDDCAAHSALKSIVKPIVAGPPLVIYMDIE